MLVKFIIPVLVLLNVLTTTTAQLPTAALGGQLTAGVAVAFATATDKLPGTANTGAVTFGFTTATELPIGGKITLALPMGFFSAVTTSSKEATAKNGAAAITSFKATCTLTGGAVGTAVLGIASADTVVCTTSGAAIPAAAVVSFQFAVAGSVTTGTPQAAATYNVQTNLDLMLAAPAATVALGGQLTAGVAMAFATATDKVPGTANTGAVTFGFTTSLAIPIGGKITFAFPRNYFSTVDSTKEATATNGTVAVASFKATCVRTGGAVGTAVLGIASADTVVCTTAGAILPTGVNVLTLIAGTVTTGSPQIASTYNIQTSVDLRLAAPTTPGTPGGPTPAGPSSSKSSASRFEASVLCLSVVISVLFASIF